MAFPIRNDNFWLISFSLSCFFDDVPKFIAISFVIKKLLVNCGSIFVFLFKYFDLYLVLFKL